jgi:hypothetical protein
MGIEVFKKIPSDSKLIVAEAVWQYSHHVLAGIFFFWNENESFKD